jgi:hypothetical protein
MINASIQPSLTQIVLISLTSSVDLKTTCSTRVHMRVVLSCGRGVAQRRHSSGLLGILVRRETADQTIAIWQAGRATSIKRQKFSILPVKHEGSSPAALSGRDFTSPADLRRTTIAHTPWLRLLVAGPSL